MTGLCTVGLWDFTFGFQSVGPGLCEHGKLLVYPKHGALGVSIVCLRHVMSRLVTVAVGLCSFGLYDATAHIFLTRTLLATFWCGSNGQHAVGP